MMVQQPAGREAAQLFTEEALNQPDAGKREQLLRQAVAADPAFAPAQFELGRLLLGKMSFREAEEALRAAVEHSPHHGYAHLNLALCLIKGHGAEGFEEALLHLRLAVEDPHIVQDKGSLREAEGFIVDLEESLDKENKLRVKERYSLDEMVQILTRPSIRGHSRYDERRLTLRLHFLPDDEVLSAEAKLYLSDVCRALRYGTLVDARILIEGYTDSIEGGDAKGREALSLKRAEAVRRHLMDQCGFDAQRFDVKGWGDRYVLESNRTADGQAANRRVELVNLKDRSKILKDGRRQ